MAFFASSLGARGSSSGSGNGHAVAYRTPVDDAPPYRPVFWRDKDVSYIASLAEQSFLARAAKTQRDVDALESEDVGDAAADRVELFSSGVGRVGGAAASRGRRRSFLWGFWELFFPSAPALLSDQYASFHTIPHYTSHSLLDRVLAFFHLVDIRNRQGNLTVEDIRRVSTEELLSLMQLALAAGERERSSFIARELSRRRIAVNLSAQPPPADTEQGDVNDLAARRAGSAGATPWMQPAPPRAWGNRGSAFFAPPSSAAFLGSGSSAFEAPPPMPTSATGSERPSTRARTQAPDRSGGFAGLNTSTDFFVSSRQSPPFTSFSAISPHSDVSRSLNISRGPEDSVLDGGMVAQQHPQYRSSGGNEEATYMSANGRRW